jgi:AcrR family transcriptional regulator
MPLREKILDAATELYAETGFRGATTRQIAQRAGVNEVTVFRHFGSKTALLHEAIRCACARGEQNLLPERPGNVAAELSRWALRTWEGLWRRRAVIRTALGDSEAHPELYPKDDSATACAGRELASYLERLRVSGRTVVPFEISAATALLMGALFSDAMSRDILPQLYRRKPPQAIAEYVTLFLRGIGVEPDAARSQETR